MDTNELGSDYQIGPSLGSGGMGTVYRGTKRSTGETVAIKVLHKHLLADPQTVARFLRERRALSRIQHPAVVRIIELISDENSLAIVMEFVSGHNLAEEMRRRRIPTAECLRLGRDVAGGLVAIHTAQVVHRDLKPSNIILATNVEPTMAKIADFGISRIATETMQATAVVGTPAYMAPECFISQHGPLAPADVYSLGVIICEMLTGATPFEGSTPYELIRLHTSDDPGWLAGVPPELTHLVRAMLAKSPDDRPSAQQVTDELNRVAAQLNGSEQPSLVQQNPATSGGTPRGHTRPGGHNAADRSAPNPVQSSATPPPQPLQPSQPPQPAQRTQPPQHGYGQPAPPVSQPQRYQSVSPGHSLQQPVQPQHLNPRPPGAPHHPHQQNANRGQPAHAQSFYSQTPPAQQPQIPGQSAQHTGPPQAAKPAKSTGSTKRWPILAGVVALVAVIGIVGAIRELTNSSGSGDTIAGPSTETTQGLSSGGDSGTTTPSSFTSETTIESQAPADSRDAASLVPQESHFALSSSFIENSADIDGDECLETESLASRYPPLDFADSLTYNGEGFAQGIVLVYNDATSAQQAFSYQADLADLCHYQYLDGLEDTFTLTDLSVSAVLGVDDSQGFQYLFVTNDVSILFWVHLVRIDNTVMLGVATDELAATGVAQTMADLKSGLTPIGSIPLEPVIDYGVGASDVGFWIDRSITQYAIDNADTLTSPADGWYSPSNIDRVETQLATACTMLAQDTAADLSETLFDASEISLYSITDRDAIVEYGVSLYCPIYLDRL